MTNPVLRLSGPPSSSGGLNGRGISVPASVLTAFLTLLGLVGVGRLSMEAWLHRPAPESLPEIGGTAKTARPLLLVVLDGVRESAVFGEEAPCAWMASFGERGVSGIALAGDPTLTATCVRAILTGRAPDIVTGFRNFDARPVEGSYVQYLAARGARTAHGGDAAIHQFMVHHYRPEDVLAFPDRGPTDQGQCDDLAVPFVLGKIAEGFDLVTLHLTRPDHAGHRWGATGEPYREACRITDRHVRTVTTSFLARHPEGTVLIASDHGVTPTGTHGGGEMAARRAPFVLVGPRVARRSGVEVSQFCLAPTLCALLGLPQPPLADAPPQPDLIELTAMEEARALSAYIEARAAVARSLGEGVVDPIERRRAAVSVQRIAPGQAGELLALADDLNALLNPSSLGHGTLALLVAAFWLVALVHLASGRLAPGAPGWLAAGFAVVAFPLALNQLSDLVPVGAIEAGALTVAASGLALGASKGITLRGVAITVACLAAVPVLTGGGLTLQAAFEAEAGGPVAGRTWAVVLLLAAALVAVARPGNAWRRLRGLAARAPGLVPAAGGALLGFLLSLRVFVDPVADVRAIVAVVAFGFVAGLVFSRPGRSRPLGERVLLLGIAAVLFLGTRVADATIAREAKVDSWTAATARHGTAWLAAGGAGFLALLALLPLRRVTRADLVGLGLALLAAAGAFAVRVSDDPSSLLSRGTVVAGLAALAATLVGGSREGRLVVRMLAAAALARRLTALDTEFAAFLVLAIGLAVAARWPRPRTRLAFAVLAAGVLATRIAAFHAMGGVESFSTVDVAAGFVGIQGDGPQAIDAAGGGRLTSQVLEAGIQMALRFALPWLLFLAAAVHVFRDAGGLRRLAADLSLGFAARAAAIATALWAMWRSGWWMQYAYPVYALGAADVVLLGVAAVFAGAWGSRGGECQPQAPEADSRYRADLSAGLSPGLSAGLSPGLSDGLSAGFSSSNL